MADPREDIRVTKTHKALAETLLSLLDQKPFRKLTVNDICQNAMVSRSTFYLHFEDKYQLLLFCLQTEQERLKEAAKEKEPQEFIRSLLATLKEREQVYRNLIVAEIDLELLHMFQTQFHSFFSEIILASEQQGATLPGPVPIMAVYYANGLTGLVMWWIQNNFHYTIEEMSLCIYNLLSDLIPESKQNGC